MKKDAQMIIESYREEIETLQDFYHLIYTTKRELKVEIRKEIRSADGGIDLAKCSVIEGIDMLADALQKQVEEAMEGLWEACDKELSDE